MIGDVMLLAKVQSLSILTMQKIWDINIFDCLADCSEIVHSLNPSFPIKTSAHLFYLAGH